MVGTAIAPSLSGIVANKNIGFSPGWLITLPALGVVLFAPLVGRLLPKLGTIKLLSFGLVPYALLGWIGAFISSDFLLIIDRILLGAATVAIQVSVTAYIAEFYSGKERMKMIAWQGMAIESGGVVFLAVSGFLCEINWQLPFYIYLLALLCFVFVRQILPRPDQNTENNIEPLVPNQNAKPRVRLIFLASLLAMMLFFVGIVTLPLYLPQSFAFGESETGYFMAFISVVAIVTASQIPRMVNILGDEKTVAFGLLLFSVAYLVFAISASIPFIILSGIFMGTGFGFTIPLLNHMMLETSSLKNQGKNLGLYSMGVFGGQFLSTFINYISGNYMVIYTVAAVLALLITMVIYLLFQQLQKRPNG